MLSYKKSSTSPTSSVARGDHGRQAAERAAAARGTARRTRRTPPAGRAICADGLLHVLHRRAEVASRDARRHRDMVFRFSRVICGSPVTRSSVAMRSSAALAPSAPRRRSRLDPLDRRRAPRGVQTRTPTSFSPRCTGWRRRPRGRSARAGSPAPDRARAPPRACGRRGCAPSRRRARRRSGCRPRRERCAAPRRPSRPARAASCGSLPNSFTSIGCGHAGQVADQVLDQLRQLDLEAGHLRSTCSRTASITSPTARRGGGRRRTKKSPSFASVRKPPSAGPCGASRSRPRVSRRGSARPRAAGDRSRRARFPPARGSRARSRPRRAAAGSRCGAARADPAQHERDRRRGERSGAAPPGASRADARRPRRKRAKRGP